MLPQDMSYVTSSNVVDCAHIESHPRERTGQNCIPQTARLSLTFSRQLSTGNCFGSQNSITIICRLPNSITIIWHLLRLSLTFSSMTLHRLERTNNLENQRTLACQLFACHSMDLLKMRSCDMTGLQKILFLGHGLTIAPTLYHQLNRGRGCSTSFGHRVQICRHSLSYWLSSLPTTSTREHVCGSSYA